VFVAVLAATPATRIDRAPVALAEGMPSQVVVHGSTWMGYALRDVGRVGSARAMWVAPAVRCTARDTSAAIWVGIDGFGNGTVEQIGTEADCRDGRAVQSAWFQLYPSDAVEIDLDIRPGDIVAARVALRDGTASVRLRNLTTGASFEHTAPTDGVGLSAEWVIESPSRCSGARCDVVPLTDVGRVSFSRCHVEIDGAAMPLDATRPATFAGSIAGVAARPTPITATSSFDVVTTNETGEA
jgi:hypothetical protein